MSVALAARPADDAARILARATQFEQRLWHLPPGSAAVRTERARFHQHGVSVVSLETEVAGFDDALAWGGALHVRAVVVDPGERNGEDREAAADALVRTLYAPVRGGAPVAIRMGAGPDDLLGFTETEWVLSELPQLALWFDPARALARHRREAGPPVASWVDAFGGRIGGMVVQGLGTDGRGGAHPTEDGPDYVGLRSALPEGAPWVLTMDPACKDDQLQDGLRFVRDVVR